MKKRYPGCAEAEEARKRAAERFAAEKEEEPDFIAGAPNYDKFTGWSPERVLAFLNID